MRKVLTRMRWTSLAVFLFGCAFMPVIVQAAPQQVAAVLVSVIDDSARADAKVLERMAASMQLVGEQILLGKSLAYLSDNKSAYEVVLGDISDRVFAGYSTKQVLLTVEDTAVVAIHIQPWGLVVQDVKVNVYLSGVDPVWSDLVKSQLPDLTGQIEQTLTGVSVDAVDWAGVLVKDLVRSEVEKNLVSFKATVDIIAGEHVQADVILIPVGDVVKGINYQLNSKTMPNIVLLDARKHLGERSEQLRGLPVAFVAKHSLSIERVLQDDVKKERIARDYKLEPLVTIAPKVDTDVVINLDSDRYRFWIEGYVDIGRDDRNLSGRAHIGRVLSKKDELFFEVSLDTSDMNWDGDLGLARQWGDTRLSVLYRVNDSEPIFRLEQDFAKRWRLRVEKFKDIDRPEFALRYRIHEFLAAEFVLGAERENYFRLVGNL